MSKKNRNRNRVLMTNARALKPIEVDGTIVTPSPIEKTRFKERKAKPSQADADDKTKNAWSKNGSARIVKKVRFSNIVTTFPSPEEEIRNKTSIDQMKKPVNHFQATSKELKSILKPSPPQESSSSTISLGFFSRLLGYFW